MTFRDLQDALDYKELLMDHNTTEIFVQHDGDYSVGIQGDSATIKFNYAMTIDELEETLEFVESVFTELWDFKATAKRS